MSEQVLVLSWLVFAHLVADFVLQNDWIAMNKGTGGRTGYAALLVHGGHVSLCLLPAVLAFGIPGLVYLVVVVVSHMLIDRWKVQATRRAGEVAQAQARRRADQTGEAPSSGLGAAWTPMPGVLFLADQVLHMTFAIVGWLVLLDGAPLLALFVDFTNALFRDWDRTAVHVAMLTLVVIASLLIVNTRAAFYFVLALVSPRELATEPGPSAPPAQDPAPVAPAPSGYTVRVGPLVATVEPGIAPPTWAGAPGPGGDEARPGGHDPDAAVTAGPGPAAPPRTASVPSGAPARIGATIGALERLLIVALMLSGAEAAVGLVIAVKTLARFKQLDDRGFAEYYLLGTLASVSVAISSALVAMAALGTLG